MDKKFFSAQSRGSADYGWLQANYSFSFASFFKPDQMRFGLLRVLNDDTIAPRMGFSTHSHENMEIVTIPLEGSLKHKDSIGNEGVIKTGEIQVMSAGTGVEHSEKNPSTSQKTNILQIWFFTEEQDLEPSYDQKAFDLSSKKNQLVTVVSPKNKGLSKTLKINQQAYLNLGEIDKNKSVNYRLRENHNGIYIFLIEGEIKIDGETLKKRDAIGVWNTPNIKLECTKDAKILLIEVPLN